VASISTTAMIGTGLSATATPNDRTCPIAWPHQRPLPVSHAMACILAGWSAGPIAEIR
jgi:hypothetical protein